VSAELPRPKLHTYEWIREIISTIVFLVAVFTLLQLAMPRSVIHGRSMEPSFEEGQRLVISRINYLVGSPDRGDVVVFNSPSPLTADEPSLIKRVIGLPGETIEFRNQQLYINGEPHNEPYINNACSPLKCPDQTWTLGEDEYFVMGDNRNNSRDSREFNAVPRENFIGEAVLRFWPLDRVGVVAHYRFPTD
jgi:signal peptidase I